MSSGIWQYARVDRVLPSGGFVLMVDPDPTGKSKPPAVGKRVMCQVKIGRSMKFHKRYWWMLNTIAEASGRWPTAKAAHEWVKWKLKMYRPEEVEHAKIIIEWDSTNFQSMGQAEFREFYDRAEQLLTEETGININDLRTDERRQFGGQP